jgi:hypothetical protein
MGDLATSPRDLFASAISAHWNLGMALTLPVTVDELDRALASIESRPLKEVEPKGDGPLSRQIEDLLRPIGAKTDPRLSSDQAKAWRGAVRLALSDVPFPIVARAIRKSWHTAFRFLNEVEADVREKIVEAEKQQRIAMWRLTKWREAVKRAAEPQPALPAPPQARATQQEVDEFNAEMRASPLPIRVRARVAADGTIETYELSADELEAERQGAAENGTI